MRQTTEETQNTLLKMLDEHYKNRSWDSPHYQSMCRCAWEAFCTTPLPTGKQPLYRHLPLTKLFNGMLDQGKRVGPTPENRDFENRIRGSTGGAKIVFVNGRFSRKYSRLDLLGGGAFVQSLSDAFRAHGPSIAMRSRSLVQQERDPLVLAGLALHQDAVLFYLPPKIRLEQPITVVHVVDDALSSSVGSPIMTPLIQWVIGDRSSCCIEVLSPRTGISLPFHSLILNQGSQVEFKLGNAIGNVIASPLRNTCGAAPMKEEEESFWDLSCVRAHLKRGASINLKQLDIQTSGFLRRDFRIDLWGEGAQAHVQSGWITQGAMHTHVRVFHHAEQCMSRQDLRGVVLGKGRSHASGEINVEPKAQETDAYHRSRTLLMSQQSRGTASPHLEIGADRVRASHGATVVPLDPIHLFYLQSRGVPLRRACPLLSASFLAPLFEVEEGASRKLNQLKEYLNELC